MSRIYILILISFLSLQTHAQLILFGKSNLPEGTPYVIAKRIQSEYIPLGIGSIYDGAIEIKIDKIIENEVLFLIIADGRNTEIQFISENENLVYIEKDKFISGGIENKIRYDFFENTNSLVLALNKFSFENSLRKLSEKEKYANQKK